MNPKCPDYKKAFTGSGEQVEPQIKEKT